MRMGEDVRDNSASGVFSPDRSRIVGRPSAGNRSREVFLLSKEGNKKKDTPPTFRERRGGTGDRGLENDNAPTEAGACRECLSHLVRDLRAVEPPPCCLRGQPSYGRSKVCEQLGSIR